MNSSNKIETQNDSQNLNQSSNSSSSTDSIDEDLKQAIELSLLQEDDDFNQAVKLSLQHQDENLNLAIELVENQDPKPAIASVENQDPKLAIESVENQDPKPAIESVENQDPKPAIKSLPDQNEDFKPAIELPSQQDDDLKRAIQFSLQNRESPIESLHHLLSQNQDDNSKPAGGSIFGLSSQNQIENFKPAIKTNPLIFHQISKSELEVLDAIALAKFNRELANDNEALSNLFKKLGQDDNWINNTIGAFDPSYGIKYFKNADVKKYLTECIQTKIPKMIKHLEGLENKDPVSFAHIKQNCQEKLAQRSCAQNAFIFQIYTVFKILENHDVFSVCAKSPPKLG